MEKYKGLFFEIILHFPTGDLPECSQQPRYLVRLSTRIEGMAWPMGLSRLSTSINLPFLYP